MVCLRLLPGYRNSCTSISAFQLPPCMYKHQPSISFKQLRSLILYKPRRYPVFVPSALNSPMTVIDSGLEIFMLAVLSFHFHHF